MIEDIRWFVNKDGTRTLQAYDGHVWFEVEKYIPETYSEETT